MDSEARKRKIEDKARRDRALTDAARAIQEILEKARQEYGADEWDADDPESTIFELVSDD